MEEFSTTSHYPRKQISELKASVLLVVDDQEKLTSFRQILYDFADIIVEAKSGEHAIELISRADFAAILLCLPLPALDGFETAKKIRSQERSRFTPLIFLSDKNVHPSDIEKAYAIGATDFLVTPESPVALVAKVRGFVGMYRSKKQTESEADHFRMLVQGTKEYAIFMLDTNGCILTWNSGAERLKGYKAEEIIGQHFSRFYPQEAIESEWPDHELRVAQRVGRFEDEGWRIHKDGTRFWANVVITALRDERGILRGYSKVTRDLTERKKSEENARLIIEESTARRVAEENARLIQDQRERLRVTLASIGDAVISTDAHGRVTFLNSVALELIGCELEEATNQQLTNIFQIVNETTRLPVENPAIRALKEGAIVGLANHTVLISKDGSERPIEDSAAPIRDVDGNIIGCVLVFRDVTGHRMAAKEVLAGQARNAAILQSALDCIITMDHEGKIVEFNPAAEQTFGYLRSEVIGKELASLIIPPSMREMHREGMATMRKTGEGPVIGKRLELSAIRADGSEFPVELAITRISIDGPPLFTAYLRDISGRKEAEEALVKSEERFRQLADAMPQIVWSTRADGKIDYQNQRWEKFTGLPESASNQGWQGIIHPEDSPRSRERWSLSLQDGTPYEMELRLYDRHTKRYRWHLIRTVSVRDQAGNVARWFGTSTDIDEQKRSEESARYLAEASAALAGVVDYESTLQKVANLAVPYFADWSAVDMANDDGTLRRLAVAHQDKEKIALVHRLMKDYPPDRDAPTGIYGVLRTGKPQIIGDIPDEMLVQAAIDNRHLDLMRSLRLKSFICVPLTISGKTVGVLTFATAESGRVYTDSDLNLAVDLAQRAGVAIENTRLYQALRDSDQRKDEFLATLAHELRNPLAPIRNSLQILGMPNVDADTSRRSREMMERQVHHLVRLVDDLLDVSRVMRGKIELRREEVELATIIVRAIETVQPLIDAQHHQLIVHIPTDKIVLSADPVRLSQVVGNLLTNAAKYTEPNGRIVLSADATDNEAILRIVDNGIGIARDMLPKVFELFVQVDHAATRSQGGLGVGLTLVRNLVEMHGGNVQAHSEGLGKGCEFVVRLPILANQARELDRDVNAKQPTGTLPTGRRLMVVDDNRDAAISFATLLRLQGHEVRVAHDGPSALDIIDAYRPDVVFLDIGMPEMDGYEVARRVRKAPAIQRTILAALTGWGQQEDRRRTKEAGFDYHLVKPPEPQLVEDLLEETKSKVK